MGPSASGKTEVAKLLETRYGLRKIVTHTTRPMRLNERQDADYHFVTKEQFLDLKARGAFVETTTYNDHYYGTSRAEIADDKCLVLDPQGARSFYALQDPRIYIVFLACPEETRIRRMHSRKDDPEKIESRICADHSSFDSSTSDIADTIIDSEHAGLDELSAEIFTGYTAHLRSIR